MKTALHLACIRDSFLGNIFAFILAFISTTVQADHIPPPDPNNISAVRAFVGDPLWGLEMGDPGVLFAKNPDDPGAEASSTKSWAIHIGTRAVNQGDVGYNESVSMSANALIPRGHGHSNMGGVIPSPGTLFRFSDMLHASMIPSASEATLAFSEHVAFKDNSALSIGADREQAFVDMMNSHAQGIGLVNTVFFNPYGGDHTHDSTGGFGQGVNHVTTAREMAMWYAHAMEVDDLFREVVGFRGVYSLNDQSNTNTWTFNNWNPGYPGMLGQKGGSNVSCNTCFVGQAGRIGRELVVSYLQANVGGDGTTLLDYGYQATFHPEFLASSAKWKPVEQQSLAVVASTRAVSAVISPAHKVDLATWKLDVNNGAIQRISNSQTPPCGNGLDLRNPDSVPPGPSFTGVIARTNPRPSKLTRYDSDDRDRTTHPNNGVAGKLGVTRGGPTEPPAHNAADKVANSLSVSTDIVHVGQGYLVLATETTKGVTLSSWGMPACGPVFYRDAISIGNGSKVKLSVLNPGMIAVGMINDNSDVEIQTWSVDLTNGQFDAGPMDTAYYLGNYDDIELASREQVILTSNLVGIAHNMDGSIRIVAWQVDSNTGDIFAHESITAEQATAYSIARVDGFEAQRDVYAVAYRRANGNLRIRVYAVSFNGTLTTVGDIDNTVFSLSANSATAIESYDKRGVMVLVTDNVNDISTNMTIWSLDDDVLNSAIDVNFVVNSDTKPAQGKPVIARIPGDSAEGDFLIGQEDFFDLDNQLQLQAWRSGPRP
jgi:D-alanyl-D-alanine carboxypeptidase